MRAILFLLLIPTTLLAQSKSSSTESVYDRTLRSTVFVISPQQDNSGRASTGSGSFIGATSKTNNPVIITNYHVVAPCVNESGKHGEVRIMFPMKNGKGEVEQNRSRYLQSSSDAVFTFRGRILAYLKIKDLALVEILVETQKGQRLPKGVTMLPLASASPKPSSRVHTIGNTGVGGMWSYTEGNVRSVYEKKFEARLGTERLRIEARLIESSNPTNQGDSGGPLVNDDGELVGVTQGGVTNANQLSTFIDIQEVRTLLQQQKIVLPTRKASALAQGLPDKQDKVELNRDIASNLPGKKEAEKSAPVDPREAAAEAKLRNARRAVKVKDYDLAESFLKQIVTDYSDTKAIVEARSLIEEIKKAKK